MGIGGGIVGSGGGDPGAPITISTVFITPRATSMSAAPEPTGAPAASAVASHRTSAAVQRVRQIDESVLIAWLERAGVAARRRRIDDHFARRRPRHPQPKLVVLQRPEPHVNVRAGRLLPAAPDGGHRRDRNGRRANLESDRERIRAMRRIRIFAS